MKTKTIKKAIITLSFGVLSTFGFSQLTLSLQACYPLDCPNPGTNYASTGTMMDATPNGNITCTTNRFGAPNTAVQFGGTINDFISVPGLPLVKPTGPNAAITVSGWYRPSTNNVQDVVFAQNSCLSNFNGYYLFFGNSTFEAGKRPGPNALCSTAAPAVTSSGHAPGNWWFVVFSVTNQNVSISVNGAPFASTPLNFPFDYANTNVILGGTNSGLANNPFSGKMDNIRFWNRVLTQAEVMDLYTYDPLCAAPCGTCNPPPPPPSGCCLGNVCGQTQNLLASDYEIPMNSNDFNFSGDVALTDKVNVGYLCNATTIGKFNSHTGRQTNPAPVTGVSPYSAGAFGISQIAQNALNVGVMGQAENFAPDAEGYGVWGRAVVDGVRGVGVRGTSEWNSAGTNFGGSFFAQKGTFNIGVEGVATPVNGNPPMRSYQTSIPLGLNIGVYGACAAPNPVFPQSPATNDWAGWFDGDVNFVGNTYANMSWFFSDRRFKSKVTEIDNVTEKISKLKGYTYEFNKGDFKKRNFPGGEQIGFIAQELKEVFPQLVIEDREGFLAVNYIGFIPVLLQAVKEQQQQISELKEQVKSFAGSPQQTGQTSQQVTLSDKSAIVLNQNVPNPFAESTVISYNIPENFAKAQIVFSDANGIVIRTVDITKKGPGSLNVFANDLTNGSYSYALVIDGTVVASKKMIKQ